MSDARGSVARVAAWVGFDAVWAVAAYGAAAGRTAPAFVAAGVYVAGLAAAGLVRRDDAVFLGGWVIAGYVVETVLLRMGVAGYSAGWPSGAVAPAWIAALWLSFGACMVALRLRLTLLVIVVTAALAPFGYIAGVRIGAISLDGDVVRDWAWIAGLWVVALVALARVEPG